MSTWLVLFLLVSSVNSEVIDVAENGSSDRIIGDIVVTAITSRFYRDFFVVNIISSSSSNTSRRTTLDTVQESVARVDSPIPIILEEASKLQKLKRRRRLNIFFVDSYSAFQKIFVEMDPINFDFDGLYTVFVTKKTPKQYSDVKKMLGDFWSLYITNINIFYQSLVDSNEWLIYTYFPFTETHCEKVVPVLYNSYVGGYGFKKPVDPYPNKIRNLHGCPLSIATFQAPPFIILQNDSNDLAGFDGRLVGAIGRSMNFTLSHKILTQSFWGHVDENGTSYGAIRMVMGKEVNFTAGYFTLSMNRNKWLSATQTYYTSNLVWVIPPGHDLTPVERFYRPFSRAIWIVMLFYLIVGVVIIIVIKLQRRNVQGFVFGTNVRAPILNMLNTLLGGPMHITPRRNFARTLLGLFLFYSLIIRNAYTGAMFRFLKTDIQKDLIQSMNEMVEENFTFFVLDAMRDNVELSKDLSGKFLVLDNRQFEAYRDFLQQHDAKLTILASEDHVAYWNKDDYPNVFFNMCKEKLTAINLCLFLHKTSCLTAEMSKYILDFSANGFIKLFQNLYIDKSYLNEKFLDSGPKALTMEHLRGALYFLFGGLVISLSCFIAEIFYYRIKAVETGR